MKKAFLAVLLLLATVPFSFGQTSDEVVSLLNEIDERSTKFGNEIASIEEFNFGIPGGKNWLVEWNNKERIVIFACVVDINNGEELFRYHVGTVIIDDIHPLAPYFDELPGRTISGNYKIGDFNSNGFDDILYFHMGAGGPKMEIIGFDPSKGEMALLFSGIFDDQHEGLPVKFITYKGMQGFMLLRGDGHPVAGGMGWVPEPPSPQAGKWFFYTWDGEQRTFVEIGEVDEALIESEWQPATAPAQTENLETEIEPETTEQQNREMPKQEKAETQNPDLTNRDFAKQENVETENLDSENMKLENVETANPENTKRGFPVLQFAVTCGAVLVAGIAVAVVLEKRRKGKATK
jgi:hypothetical protein